jgi:uncharacterized membrane protein
MAQVRSREKRVAPASANGATRQASAQPSGFRWADVARHAPAQVAIAVMALIGLGISIYLTVVHYDTKVSLVCTAGGLVNCGNVTTSAWSVVPGTAIPVTIPGMLWFVVSGGLAVLGLWRLRAGRQEPARLPLAQVIWGLGGLLFVIYLIYCEAVLVHNICEWCTAVHALTFLTFILAFYRLQRGGEGHDLTLVAAAPEPATSSTRQARQLAMSRRARRVANGSATGGRNDLRG